MFIESILIQINHGSHQVVQFSDCLPKIILNLAVSLANARFFTLWWKSLNNVNLNRSRCWAKKKKRCCTSRCGVCWSKVIKHQIVDWTYRLLMRCDQLFRSLDFVVSEEVDFRSKKTETNFDVFSKLSTYPQA